MFVVELNMFLKNCKESQVLCFGKIGGKLCLICHICQTAYILGKTVLILTASKNVTHNKKTMNKSVVALQTNIY